MDAPRILIVEDDAELLRSNKRHLESQGYEVVGAESLASARRALVSLPPDLVLLDVQMPDGSGFDFCEEIRRRTSAPIVYLTCRGENEDVVRGLQLGGDDYIVKPFDLEVLSARVFAQLRRAGTGGAGVIELPPLRLDMKKGQAFLNGRAVPLAPKELQLLAFFATSPGKEHSAKELLEAVWGDEGDIATDTVKMHVSRIRKKLGLGEESPFEIRATRRRGYVFSRVLA
ncbi:response regulator transcription factor [Synergistaceae bacterium OttesenSCG-928-I11]|nr:response regulator transcription factor [Synergistaceae bacterium OttesenSCG-928-I11]